MSRALAAKPDLLYLGASGPEADVLLAALARARPGIPLLVSPFSVDTGRPSRALAAELGAVSAIGRPANLAPDDLAAFARHYTVADDTADDALALLGYAAGLVALDRGTGALPPAKIELRQLRSIGRAQQHQTLAELPLPAAATFAGGASWTNPYLIR